MRIRSRRTIAVLILVVSVLVVWSGMVFAQNEGTVLIDGLNGPMGVLVDDDGNVWVIDSGMGGSEVFSAINPEVGPIEAAAGESARIVMYDPATDLTSDFGSVWSYGLPEAGFSGGGRLAMLDGALYASVSDWLAGDPPEDPPVPLGTIVQVSEDGTNSLVFDGWAHERDVNPYGAVLHAHPFGMIASDHGTLLVADSGANAILDVDPATGEATVVAVMEPMPGVFPRPEYNNELLTDPVPTSVAMMDGTLYASLLSGAPFVPGSAKVVSINDDGTVSDYATGLSMLIDLRTGPDGALYGVSFAVSGEQGPMPGTGALLRIGEGDTSEVIVGGLTFPSSVDFDADGNAYVSINGVGAPGSGQVLRFDGATSMTGTPYNEVLANMMAAPAEAVAETAEPAEEAAEAEPTRAPKEEPTAEPAEEAVETVEPAEEATAAPVEEMATEAPAEEATAVPAEEMAEAPAEEATAVPAEEMATEAPAEEAAAVPAEEMATEAPAEEMAATEAEAMATAAPAEETTEEVAAPTTLPVTGAETPVLAMLLASVAVLLLLGAAVAFDRKRIQ